MLEIVSNYETIRNLHRVLEHAIKFHPDFHATSLHVFSRGSVGEKTKIRYLVRFPLIALTMIQHTLHNYAAHGTKFTKN